MAIKHTSTTSLQVSDKRKGSRNLFIFRSKETGVAITTSEHSLIKSLSLLSNHKYKSLFIFSLIL